MAVVLTVLGLVLPGLADEITLTVSNASDRDLEFTMRPSDLGGAPPGESLKTVIGCTLGPSNALSFNFVPGGATIEIEPSILAPPLPQDQLTEVDLPEALTNQPPAWDNPIRSVQMIWREQTNTDFAAWTKNHTRCIPGLTLMMPYMKSSQAYTFAVVDNQWVLIGRPRSFAPRSELNVPEEMQLFIPVEEKLSEAEHQLPRLPILAAASLDEPACIPKGFLAHRRRTILEAFQKHGLHDPKTDALAQQLLAGYCTFWPGQKKDQFRLDPYIPLGPDFTEKQLNDLLDQAKELDRLGVSDPMVLYVMGEVYLRCQIFESTSNKAYKPPDHTAEAQAIACLERAIKGFAVTNYPAVAEFRAISSYYEALSPFDELTYHDEYDPRLMSLAAKQLVDGSFDGEDQLAFQETQAALQNIRDRDMFDCTWPEMESVSPWLQNMLIGFSYERTGEIDAAHNEAGFGRQLARAGECYAKAWSVDQTRPEPAVKLAQLSRRKPQGVAGRTVREWFDQAVMLDANQPLVYWIMIRGMMPNTDNAGMQGSGGGNGGDRGSFEAVFEYGKACAATKRYDTVVPLMCFAAMRSIANQSAQFKPLEREQTLETMLEAMHQTANNPRFARQRNWIMSMAAGIAFQAKREEYAAKVLHELGDGLMEEPLELAGGPTMFSAGYVRDQYYPK